MKISYLVSGAVLALGVLLSPLWLGYIGQPVTAAPGSQTVEAAKADEVANEPKEEVPVKDIRAYGDKVKKNSDLPPSVKDDPSKHVVAVNVVPADDHAQKVISVIDIGTGEVTNHVKEEPLPWVAYNFHGEIGPYYGLRNGDQTAGVEWRPNVLQVKGLYVQGKFDLEQNLDTGGGSWFAGAQVVYRY